MLETKGGSRPRVASMAVLALLVGGGALASLTGILRPPALLGDGRTDYAVDLERTDGELLPLAESVFVPPLSAQRATRYAALRERRAALTGLPADEAAARAALDEARRRVGGFPDLLLVAADFNLRFHRLPEARDDLRQLPADAGTSSVEALRADLALQEGDYAGARRHCEAALRRARTWDVLARLAHLESLTGDPATADALYVQAEDELTAKEMRAYAWVELQRGLLALDHGRHAEAGQRYDRAERAYSGDWRVAERRAELLAREGRFGEARALYERVVARVPRPEIQQALGDLLAYVGRRDAAEVWHERALAGYLASVQRGEVQYLHHLASFYADVREDGEEALRWAQRDRALRGDFRTREALAWALYRAGRFTDALEAIQGALQSGVKDAHLDVHAAVIHLAAGRTGAGRDLLARAAEINPRHDRFHVHR